MLLVVEDEKALSYPCYGKWEEDSYVIFEPQIYIHVVQLISVVLKAGSG